MSPGRTPEVVQEDHDEPDGQEPEHQHRDVPGADLVLLRHRRACSGSRDRVGSPTGRRPWASRGRPSPCASAAASSAWRARLPGSPSRRDQTGLVPASSDASQRDPRRGRHRHQLAARRGRSDDRGRHGPPLRDPRAREGDGAARIERRRHARAAPTTPSTAPSRPWTGSARSPRSTALRSPPSRPLRSGRPRTATMLIDRAWDEAHVRGERHLRRRGGAPHPPRRAPGRAGLRPPPPAVRHRRREHRAAGGPARRGARRPAR